MSDHPHKRGVPPSGDALRHALRWLSETRRHDAAAVEEACRRFDLSPLDEEFLLAEARRIAAPPAVASSAATPADPPAVSRPREADERPTREGVRILESWNVAADPAASIARARLAPGEATEWHFLAGTAERYLVVAGHGLVEVGDRPAQPVGAGDVVFIPAGVTQRVRCAGEDDLVFYCVCTPRFEERHYRIGKPGHAGKPGA